MVSIPEDAKKAIRVLLHLPAQSIDRLHQVLQEEKPSISPKELAEKIFKKAELPLSEVQDLLSFFCNLHLYRTHQENVHEGAGVDRILEDYVSDAEANTTHVTLDALKKLVGRFLPLDSIFITVKVAKVFTDHEKVFFESAILTDLRPVFRPDVKEIPPVALIVHNLSIAYYEGREPRKAVFALDNKDLLHLKKVVEKALQKSESVKQLVKKETLFLERSL